MTGPADGWMGEVTRRLSRPWPDRPLLLEKGEGQTVREAAVLIPLYVRERELWTLFTRRTDDVPHHKGQISFPGGGRDADDANLWSTAVREAEEEVGIPAASVRLLGALPKLVTVSDFEVSPFVGAVPYPIEFQMEGREVAEIIQVPVSYLLNPEVVEERPLEFKGRRVPTRVYHYRGHAIWGVTAHILTDFLEVLRA